MGQGKGVRRRREERKGEMQQEQQRQQCVIIEIVFQPEHATAVQEEPDISTSASEMSPAVCSDTWEVLDVPHDSLFTASELGVLEPCSLGPVKESSCKVHPGSRVQRVFTRSDRKVEVGSVTLIEDECEVPFVVLTAIVKNPHRCEIYWRNARDTVWTAVSRARCSQ